MIDGLLEDASVVDLNGKFEIEDKTNGIVARIGIIENQNALVGNVFGMFSKRPEKEVPIDKNQVQLTIFKRVSGQKILFSDGSGNFARYLQIDKKVYFAHSKVPPLNCKFEEHTDKTLPSSSILRKEIELLTAGKFEDAQA